MISPQQFEKLRVLLDEGKEQRFYTWGVWLRTADHVRNLDNNECQMCKARGRHSAGRIVHHIKHLRDRPDLALSLFDPDTGERQLMTVCKHCHETEHPEAFRQLSASLRRSTDDFPEYWD